MLNEQTSRLNNLLKFSLLFNIASGDDLVTSDLKSDKKTKSILPLLNFLIVVK